MHLKDRNCKSGKFRYLRNRETCCVCGQAGKGCRELDKINVILYFCRGNNPTETIILTPDAGSRANENVLRQYQAIANLLKSWGIKLRVEDWDQSDSKDNCDSELV